MSNEIKRGICRLCGQYKKLTFEHVPPHSAFNSNRLRIYRGDQIFSSEREDKMPWDTSGLKYKSFQNGYGDYYLCSDCNSKTGSWYANDYSTFVNSIGKVLWDSLQDERSSQLSSIYFETVKPVFGSRVFKQIMTMFCDINENLHKDVELQKYILDPEYKSFDSEKYKVYTYLCYEGFERTTQFTAVFRKGLETVCISEICSFPLGISLYINLRDTKDIPGACINDFSSLGYDETCSIKMNLPVLNNYTGIPLDFRKKEEIDL